MEKGRRDPTIWQFWSIVQCLGSKSYHCHSLLVPVLYFNIRTMLGLLEFAHLTYSKEDLVNFLIQHNVLTCTVTCNRCGNNVDIDKNTLTYRCRKRYTMKNAHKKRISKQCDFYKSAKTGTWLDKSHLDVSTVCKIVACFLMLRHPRHNDTHDETGAASATIINWFSFCQEVTIS